MRPVIYLDHSATTRVRPEAAELVHQAMVTKFGNPSSLHDMGLQAEELVKTARRQLAAVLNVDPAEIYFTGGGTESNNLAIRGAAKAQRRRGRHIITTAVEHPSVLATCRDLANDGWDVTVLPVDGQGRVSPTAVIQALRSDTVLVSVMMVNNELGTIQPVAAIGALLAARAGRGQGPLFHVDAVQALGKIPVRPRVLAADLVTVSGHKIYAPKGVGALYVRRGVHLTPRQTGGEQEYGLRPGTENVPAIAAFGLAANLAEGERSQQTARLGQLHRYFVAALSRRLPSVSFNSLPPVDAPPATADHLGGVPHIVNISFPGLAAETLVHALAAADIYVSTGSACHSRQQRVSHVLTAIGLPAATARGSVRISMGATTTDEHLERLVDMLAQLVPDLLAMGRRH